MVRPTSPLTSSILDQVQGRGTLDGNVKHDPAGSSDSNWFLPGSDSSLSSITAVAKNDLQGASPEAIATQVVAHIGG